MIKFDFEEELDKRREEIRRRRRRDSFTDDESNVGGKRAKLSHQVVCRHWLRGMCINGAECDFLHILDASRMPICPNWKRQGKCIEHDMGFCLLKHDAVYGETDADTHAAVKAVTADKNNVCMRYIYGFCPNGPLCQQMHHKLSRDTLPKDAMLPDWYLYLILGKQSGDDLVIPPLSPSTRQMDAQIWQALADKAAGKEIARRTLDDVLPEDSICPHGRAKSNLRRDETLKMRAFVIKSGKIENILTSVQRGIWATGKANISRFEEAFQTCDQVIFLMSANESGGFQGYARMASMSDPQLYPKIWGSFSTKLSANFRLHWLKQCKLDFEALASFTNPWNENKPLKKSRDGQELPLDLAEAVVLRLESLPAEDLLIGTPLEGVARIDHQTFFKLSEAEKCKVEAELGLRRLAAPPPPPPKMHTQNIYSNRTRSHFQY